MFLARDSDRRSFAIKVFRLDITPEQAAELASQLGVLSRVNLEHPSIAAPVTAGVEGTVAYLVQEYVGADSLDAAIRQYGPAPLGQALKILTNVAAALDFGAAVNVHHGALHPRDLLVTPDQVRVTGLGVAAALETIGLRAPIRRPYTAPERVQREGWDSRADVFSLGVLARELVLGRGVRGDGEPRVPEPVAERLQDIIARATAARPSDRCATSLDLVRDLQDALAGGESAPASAASRKASPARSLRPPRGGRGLLLPLDAEPPAADAPRGEGVPVAPVPYEPVRFSEVEAPPARTDDDEVTDLPLNHGADTLAALNQAADTLADEPGTIEAIPADEVLEPSPGAADTRFSDLVETPAAPTIEPETETRERFARSAPRPQDMARPQEFEKRGGGSRAPLLAFAAVLLVGLVIGAVGGYLWGTRGGTAPGAPPTAADVTAGQPTGASATPSAANPQTAVPPVSPAGTAAGRPGGPATAPGTAAKPPAPIAAAPAPKDVKGRLSVRSTPGGATVTVNGRRRGVTPLRLSDLSAGRYTVRVARSGYGAEERQVVISADRPSSALAITLKRSEAAAPASRATFVGSLNVESVPPGAKVFLDGRLVGTTPCVVPEVAVGSHVVRVDMIGFRRWAQSVQVKSGARVRVTAALERESQ